MTATNPQTGEKVVLRGGQWVPAGQPAPAPQPQQAPPSIQIKPAPRPDPVEQQRDAIGLQRDQVALQKAQVDLQAAQATNPSAGKVTEAERNAAFLATRLETASRQMADVLSRNPGAASPSLRGEVAGMFGQPARRFATDADRQQIEAAQLDFLDSALTLSTGAAYTREQIEGYRESYFPQIGDKPETVEAKQQRLRALLQSARVKSGTAVGQIDQAIEAIFGQPTRAPLTRTVGEGGRSIATGQGSVSYSTETDNEFAAVVEAAFRNGANRQEMDAIAAKYGRAPYGPDLDRAIQMRERGGIVTFLKPQTGKKDVSAEQAAVGEFMASPTGATLAGAGNGLLLGGLDEVGGALKSAVTGMPLDQAIAEADLMKQIIAEQNPTAYTLGNIGGGAVSGLVATGGAARLGLAQGGNILSPGAIATDVALGTVAGGLESNQDRLGGAFKGAGAGVLGGAAGRTIGKGIAPTGGQSLPLYEAGVRPTPGQRLGSVVNWAEETMGSVPFVGGAIRGARQKARDQFEAGAFNNALKEIDTKLPKGVQNGADAHRFAQKRFAEAYDKARDGLSLVRDEKLVDDFKALADEIAGGGLTEQSTKRFQAILKDVVDRKMPNGRMDGAQLKQVQSALGKRIAALRNAPSGDAELADALEGLSSMLDDAARRSSTPEAVAALDAADRGYAQLVRIERASVMGGAEEAGRFTPNQYARAVKQEAGGRATRSKAYLRGDAIGQEYADAGLRLADRVPNSGTAERAATLAAVGGAGYVAPQTLAIPVAAAIPYLPGVRNVTNALLAPRTGMVGKVANPIGRTISRASLAGPNALLLADQN